MQICISAESSKKQLMMCIMKPHDEEEAPLQARNKQKNRFALGVRQWLQVLPFIGGGLILMCLFVLYPLLRNIQISLNAYNIIKNQTGAFLGLSNYVTLTFPMLPRSR